MLRIQERMTELQQSNEEMLRLKEELVVRLSCFPLFRQKFMVEGRIASSLYEYLAKWLFGETTNAELELMEIKYKFYKLRKLAKLMEATTPTDGMLQIARQRWTKVRSFGWTPDVAEFAAAMTRSIPHPAKSYSFGILDAKMCREHFKQTLAIDDENQQEMFRGYVNVVDVLEKLTDFLMVPFVTAN